MEQTDPPAKVASTTGLGPLVPCPMCDSRSGYALKDGVVTPMMAELTAFAEAVRAAERERIARHFDARDRGRDGEPMGIGFYDPHEPAEIIRALGPNVAIKRGPTA